MKRWLLRASLLLALACQERPEPAGPRLPQGLEPQASLLDPALQTALATAAPTDSLVVIVNFDETATTLDAITTAVQSLGAGVVQFRHFSMVAALGTASGGYYTGVAPGANLIGLGTGDVLFVFWALAGFDYILDHQQQYNIKVVNNSWGTSGAFDPNDPINEASKAVHDHGITVVFAAGNDGPDQNTLNPFSVAPG